MKKSVSLLGVLFASLITASPTLAGGGGKGFEPAPPPPPICNPAIECVNLRPDPSDKSCQDELNNSTSRWIISGNHPTKRVVVTLQKSLQIVAPATGGPSFPPQEGGIVDVQGAPPSPLECLTSTRLQGDTLIVIETRYTLVDACFEGECSTPNPQPPQKTLDPDKISCVADCLNGDANCKVYDLAGTNPNVSNEFDLLVAKATSPTKPVTAATKEFSNFVSQGLGYQCDMQEIIFDQGFMRPDNSCEIGFNLNPPEPLGINGEAVSLIRHNFPVGMIGLATNSGTTTRELEVSFGLTGANPHLDLFEKIDDLVNGVTPIATEQLNRLYFRLGLGLVLEGKGGTCGLIKTNETIENPE